ncbi:uncharacterized protein [Henckelia pumila]
MESKFLARQFGGHLGRAKRAEIHEKLISLACSDSGSEIDDFVRLYILFIFNCVIFSTGNYYTPSFIFPYLDDLTTFFDYAWGDAAFRYLCRSIRNIESKSYLDGCTVGLMAWVYERIPSLAVPRSLKMFPRLFRWGDSKIPLKTAKAESLLKSIDSTKILSIYLFYEEKKFLEPTKVNIDSIRVDNIVRKEVDEIKKLLCVELRNCEKQKILVDKEVHEFGSDFQLKSKNECGVVIEEYETSEKDEDEVNLYEMEKEINEGVGTDSRNVSCDSSQINALLLNVVTDIQKENNDDVRGDKENDDSGTSDLNKGMICAGTPEKNEMVGCENVSETGDNSKGLSYVSNEVGAYNGVGFENDSKIGDDSKGVSCGATSDVVKEKDDVLASEYDYESGDNSKVMSSNSTFDAVKDNTLGVGVEQIPAIQSSIVDTVRTRVDRKKKRKSPMFVTPPSSTPRPKRKCKKLDNIIECIDDNSNSPVEDDLLRYKDRLD